MNKALVLILLISGCATAPRYNLYINNQQVKQDATPEDFCKAKGQHIELRRGVDNKAVFADRER